jgi:hypothetical protein
MAFAGWGAVVAEEQPAPPQPQLVLKETSLGNLPEKGDVWVSPNLRHVLYVEQGEKKRVVVDGVPGKEYDEVVPGRSAIGAGEQGDGTKTFFSPDGERVGYMACSGEKWVVVVDGAESGACTHVEGLRFSPDGKHVMYLAQTGEKWYLVVDNKSYEGATGAMFSPDSKHVAWIGPTEEEGRAVYLDGKPGKRYGSIGRLRFSADSKSLAYLANGHVVFNGVEQKAYNQIGTFFFSPDSKHIAYTVVIEGKRVVVLDGREGKPYDATSDAPPGAGGETLDVPKKIPVPNYPLVFSPNSSHIAYRAKLGSKWMVVRDGVDGKQYDSVGAPVFSPDSKTLAYAAVSGETHYLVTNGAEKEQKGPVYNITFSPNSRRMAYFVVLENRKCVVVSDNVESKPYDCQAGAELTMGPVPFFSEDSEHLIYIASAEGWRVVLDGTEGDKYNVVSYPLFRPDMKRIAYCAGECAAVLDGVKGKQYRAVKGLVFSPNFKHLAYVASANEGDACIVVDGQEIGQYTGYFYCQGTASTYAGYKRIDNAPVFLIFDSLTKCHAVMRRGGEAFLVEVKIGE